jgi:hypothetical protein
VLLEIFVPCWKKWFGNEGFATPKAVQKVG